MILQHEDQLLDKDDLSYYRAKRLAELKNLKNNNHAVRQQQKVFGNLTTIDAEDYADCIDDEWKTIPVIVHLYDEVCYASALVRDKRRERERLKYTKSPFLLVNY